MSMSQRSGSSGSSWGQIAAALAVALVGYGIGRAQGTMATGAAQEQLEEARAQAKNAQEGLAAVDKRVGLLEARRQMHLALIALETGEAESGQRHLRLAASQMKPATGGSFVPILQRLEAIRVPEAGGGSLTGQRQQILEVVQAFDALIPAPAQMSGAGS